MKATVVTILIIILGACCIFAQETAETPQAKKERIEAERLWEQMIEVKGGREKLHSISNMLVTEGETTSDKAFISLYVFPNKFWQWQKDKSFHDLMFLTMANLDLRKFFVVSHDGIDTNEDAVSDENYNSYQESYLMDGCEYFLETKWLQPTPVRIAHKKLSKTAVDVLETRFTKLEKYHNRRMDYFIDPESLIVLAVEENTDAGAHEFISFGNYILVDGIQVPTSYKSQILTSNSNNPKLYDPKKDRSTPLKFEFNVYYNEDIFRKIPTLEAGSDAWKPK